MKNDFMAIVDYGLGNLMSVSKAFARFYKNVHITSSKKKILEAKAIVLPGVGSFRDAIRNIEKLGLIKPIISSINSGKPFFGICLGLQLLFSQSEENGTSYGLNIIKGVVRKFPAKINLKIPHIGWNRINMKKSNSLFNNIPNGSYVYFVHSYYGDPDIKDLVASDTLYGIRFPSTLIKDNIFAMQFHPEKSQKVGLTIIKNFLNIINKC
ncbi:MAG: imidazole glycerol phosphate synthase subunit HisH [Candidatus Firestonebacteria bacterium]